MKLIIDISDEEYKTLSELPEQEKVNELSYYERVIAHGIPYEERPQGKWELHGMIYYCSNCGHYSGESGDNFCGNCGADMRGAE